MTEKDLEIQELRRELEKVKKENDVLKTMHYCDLSETITLRRQVECLMEFINNG